jgi:arabinose-5-phosphate isomerase
VKPGTGMRDAVLVMTAKTFGCVGIADGDGTLVGVITDGDLRRNIERGLDHQARDFMTSSPKTIAPDTLVDEALRLFDEYRITALFVVEGERPVGVLHIHDCPAAR